MYDRIYYRKQLMNIIKNGCCLTSFCVGCAARGLCRVVYRRTTDHECVRDYGSANYELARLNKEDCMNIDNEIQELKDRLAKLEASKNDTQEIVYDGNKGYVGVDKDGEPFILVCTPTVFAHKYARFHNFVDAEYGYAPPFTTGQEAIDDALYDGFKITAFDNREDCMMFFMEQLDRFLNKD